MDIDGVIESIESLRASREAWFPAFEIDSEDDALAVLNLIGAFK